jgi:signal peptidase II
MQHARKYIIALLIAMIIVVLDMLSKSLVLTFLRDGPSYEVTSFFSLNMVKNYGISFGLLRGYNHIFLILLPSLIILGLIIYTMRYEKGRCYHIAMIIGGALGNIYDRLTLGYVVDFLDFHISNWHYPAFNVADMAVCIGVFMWLFGRQEKQ